MKGPQLTVHLAGAGPSASGSSPDAVCTGDQGKRLLVVDDNRDSAEMLCEVLQAYGCATCVAYDGTGALKVAQSFKPEVALIDISLPQMDGYELARRIRRLPGLHEIRLIAVTGYSDAADRQRSVQAGFDSHLVKPVDLEALRGMIKN